MAFNMSGNTLVMVDIVDAATAITVANGEVKMAWCL
jgi:hypothetical protein